LQEQQAKQEGKNRLTLAVLRRSGEHAFAGCPWEYVGVLEAQVERFRKGSSDRWSYQMRREMNVLEGLDPAAFETELRRMIGHGEKPDLGFVDDFHRYRELCGDADPRGPFVALCQSASFLARGEVDR
jgi:CRISPR-associated protein Cmr2